MEESQRGKGLGLEELLSPSQEWLVLRVQTGPQLLLLAS